MKSNKWIRFARILIILFTIILFFNAYSLFIDIKQGVSYNNRAYGLSVLDDEFNNGEYYSVYLKTIKNEITDESPLVDTSEYEKFGRVFDAYLKAKVYNDDSYIEIMKKEKSNITWNKILTVIESLENDLKDK